jgi:hypothetical protein
MSAGKGDKPRNCHSNNFFENYDLINWNNKNKEKNQKKRKNQKDEKKE